MASQTPVRPFFLRRFEVEIFFEKLLAELPPFVARVEVPRLTGGAISVRGLANLDYRGQGPSGRMVIGRRVVYPRESLVNWLRERSRPCKGSGETR